MQSVLRSSLAHGQRLPKRGRISERGNSEDLESRNEGSTLYLLLLVLKREEVRIGLGVGGCPVLKALYFMPFIMK
jgi:hypothetical protein